ncbi:uncharacterized protein LOC126742188 isoform X4 [Anthonomus grandis grandis]|uniref:uncharacterized protein LOC126742188 isoform X4 n=1 Tax=Anthonomus grandis grandis TaxID=2921223 RepID=UPI0021657A95|nr:uncharacterized protein LOC126742188 isoform X4 [Anthonomus grandis grandis]
MSHLEVTPLKIILILAALFVQVNALERDAHRRPVQQGKLYFAIAVSSSGGQTFGRAFNKTLTNITQNHLYGTLKKFSYNISLEPLVIELPENGSFSSTLLENVCGTFEGKHVVAVLIVGSSPAAFTVSLTARHAGIPVLWARGQSEVLPGFRTLESSPLEVHLAPTGLELVQALRGLLLQAHWHTFTLLADPSSATSLRSTELWKVLQAPPLRPTLVALPNPLRPQSLFRKLADISRSTRGVVILCSDSPSAIRILEDAKRLNMMDGHFVWIWIDTDSSINIHNASDEDLFERAPTKPHHLDKRSAFLHGDINEMHINYLLRNDHFLLLNRNNNGPSSVAISKLHRKGAAAGPPPSRISFSVKSERAKSDFLPAGLLSLKPVPVKVDRHLVKGAVRLLMATLKSVLAASPAWAVQKVATNKFATSCWEDVQKDLSFSSDFGRNLKLACTEALSGIKNSQEIGVDKVDKSLVANFEILNLVPERSINNNTTDNIPQTSNTLKWKRVGFVSGRNVRLDTIIWPGGDLSVAAVSVRARTVFRVVTALAPPFVMESELDEDGQCLRGLPCHRVLTSDKDNLTLVFNEMQRLEEEEEEQEDEEEQEQINEESADYDEYGRYGRDYDEEKNFFPFQKFKYRTNCCYGLSMDLLENIAQELEFDFRLYIVADGLFGSRIPMGQQTDHQRVKRDVGKKFLSYRFKGEVIKSQRIKEEKYGANAKWNGIVGDLVSGAAHMSFAALSVSSARSEVIDFSAPYFFSGVSFLASPQQRSEIPLLAFLLPFSFELWLAILISLNITAIAVAIYEWLSPFGLNPWGRQRSKNFSMSSALWVMWGLLCGHLVAFKAPKSWPNKFLINVWGGFSVIFVASYTANIAALIAGLFFQNTVSNYHDRSLLSQRVGTPKSSAAEYYVQKANQMLWQHMSKYSLENAEEGVERLRNGSLDMLIADTPILDYYRATDHGCKLQKIGDTINEDTYAIGMTKGFPLKDSISAVIAKYSSNGYMDILQEKWYGGLPCFKLAQEIAQPRPLGVAAVTGVFILLGMGIVIGLVTLTVEHLFFKYALPMLRDKPKESIWRSRNIMFFSQKLYRFINCVELVSPHHAARELVHTIRQGQITSLFQKSIKRKEHEQRRRRKSKAQFFEMIQEIRRRNMLPLKNSNIRRQQQQQEENQTHLQSVTEVDSEYNLSPEEKKSKLSPSILKRTFMRGDPDKKIKSPTGLFGKQLFSPRSNKAKSSTALNVRRFSTDSVFNSQTALTDRSATIGRRLSKDASAFLSSSPPDINSRRSSYLDVISTGSKLSGKSPVLSIENISDCGSTKSAEPSIRKLSDCESIGKKLATLPKYQGSFDKTKLQPQYSLTLGKSDETLTNVERVHPPVAAAKSFNSIDGLDRAKCEEEVEFAKRSKETIVQLQEKLKNKSKKSRSLDNNKPTHSPNPQIRIQVEDADSSEKITPKRNPPLAKTIRSKSRHQSLGDHQNPLDPLDHVRRTKLHEQSKSLDSATSRIRSRSRSRSRSRQMTVEDDLPPAPPPPNCSPRNSDGGKSPLDRLSKDDLVKLWRSSESELRSHLLKAIRDKEEPSDPT